MLWRNIFDKKKSDRICAAQPLLLQTLRASLPTVCHYSGFDMASSRFALVDHVRVSREGQQAIELDVAQVTPSSIARVFSVSDYHYKLCTMTGLCVGGGGRDIHINQGRSQDFR